MSNLSEERRVRMLSFLDALRQANQDDVTQLRAINEIEQALNEKKYGLTWEAHRERVDDLADNNILVFHEVKDKLISHSNVPFYNFILEGDNLHSLKLLEKTHSGLVDVVYIDPPYNTGNNDFKYNDKFIDKNDSYTHSKWLSFMFARLTIAYKLLKRDGLIIINIDENEGHQLKLLLDEIFGESNYIGEFIWKARSGKSGTSSLIAMQHEYIYCYAKDKSRLNFYVKENITDKDELENLRQWGQKVYRSDRPTMFFPIYYKNDEWVLPTKAEIADFNKGQGVFDDGALHRLNKKYEQNGYTALLPMINGEYGRWRTSYNGVVKLINDGLLKLCFDSEQQMIIKKIKPKGRVSKVASDSIISDCGSASTGTSELKQIFSGRKVFDTTKPLALVKKLLYYGVYNKSEAIVLDFFAGSGTTGHALMELNSIDNGKRRYILCTNNDNNICEEVTYQRLLKIQDKLPHNLKYYKTGLIEKTRDMPLMEELLDNIKPLIELESACNIDSSSMKVFLTEDEFDAFVDAEEVINLTKIFLASDIMLSASQEEKLRYSHCEAIRIPEYYYRDELIESGDI